MAGGQATGSSQLTWDQAARQAERELPFGTNEEREERALQILEGPPPVVVVDEPKPMPALSGVDWGKTPDIRDMRDPEKVGKRILSRGKKDAGSK